MRPLTDQIPKPLLFVGGVPLIETHRQFVRRGHYRLVVNMSYLADQLSTFWGVGAMEGRYRPIA